MSNKLFIIQLLHFTVSLLIFYMAGKAKRKEKRSACRRPIKHTGFFTVQNNQLYNIAGYL